MAAVTGIIAVIDILNSAITVAGKASELLQQAQREGRDVSAEELQTLRDATDETHAEWNAVLKNLE